MQQDNSATSAWGGPAATAFVAAYPSNKSRRPPEKIDAQGLESLTGIEAVGGAISTSATSSSRLQNDCLTGVPDAG